MDPSTYKFDTLSLHGGHQPDKNYGSRAVPIYQTTSYVFQDTDHAAALFNLEQGGHIYSRISNPTVGVLEERVCALEGGTVADIAHKAGIPLMVDCTFNTPYLCRALDFGADIVVHSLTKWMCGHGTSMGGIIVEGGKFDWQQNDKFPTMTEPYPGYHGLSFAEEFGPVAFTMRARAEGMRDMGPCMSPTNAFNILQGIETLSVRMDKHLSNAKSMLEYLSNHDGVAWVSHPDLPDHPDHEVAKKMLPKGAGSMIAFGVKGGRKAGEAFINAVKLASNLANVGDSKTLVIHPASTTHAQMDGETMKHAGLTEDMIRFSVGIEDVQDIMNDFDNGFRAAKRLQLKAAE